jgi:dTDP-4-amino-4,6-dideoxy-D-galactose acyltransferase
MCTLLDWDSQFFMCRIARLWTPRLSRHTCAAALDWCRAEAIDCLYLFASLDDEGTSLLGPSGFELVDVRLDLSCEIGDRMMRGAVTAIRPAAEADVPGLRAIAARSHHATRFYFDRRFSRERCDELYRTWISRSCEGWADGVLVATAGNAPEGYITMHVDDGQRGRIGLVGVDEHVRGHGIGASLVAAALDWFRDRGVTGVSVATQARNIAGVRLYEAAGFRIAGAGAWYHRWFGERSAAT